MTALLLAVLLTAAPGEAPKLDRTELLSLDLIHKSDQPNPIKVVLLAS